MRNAIMLMCRLMIALLDDVCKRAMSGAYTAQQGAYFPNAIHSSPEACHWCAQMENQRLYTIVDRLNTRGSDHLSDTASQLSDLSSYAPREVCVSHDAIAWDLYTRAG